VCEKSRQRSAPTENFTIHEAKNQALFSCQVAQKCFRKFVQFVDGAKVASMDLFCYTLIKKRERGAGQ